MKDVKPDLHQMKRTLRETVELVDLFMDRLETLAEEGVTEVPDDLEFDIDTLTIYDPKLASAISARLEDYLQRKEKLFRNCYRIFQELLLDSVDLAIDTLFADPNLDNGAKAIRAWAHANNVPVSARGRVAASVRTQYGRAARRKAEERYADALAGYDARLVVTGNVAERKERYLAGI